MSNKAESRVLLEKYEHLLNKTILVHQNPVTGLLPAFVLKDGTAGWASNHAWVRDNVYSVVSVWGLALAFRNIAERQDDKMKAFHLEQSVVKLMRGLLFCMMRQTDKVEKFKKTLERDNALHAKFNMQTCAPVVGDFDWGHLQIDATALYLLMLAQMTASGLQIIYTLDEVAFVQNLVFYIEDAFKTPDYGIWERGDKSNHGETELNATSIGMAKAALDAISGLDLFGARGGPSSIICVMHDKLAQCNAKLESLLPRESSSKEVDAGLLSIIGFPAFAVEDIPLIHKTKHKIEEKLLGEYGCKRFLRDGYQTVREDPHRLHYEYYELKVFENIECEWPLFIIYLVINAIFDGHLEEVERYHTMLEKLVIKASNDLVYVPELYLVPEDKVPLEYKTPHSQPRVPSAKVQHMWAQSLYILCGLLRDRLIAPGEIDPLNRRLCMQPRHDPIVQVVLLAEDQQLCAQLKKRNIHTETIRRVERNPTYPVKILPAKYLTSVYSHLGVSKKMNLTGRPPHVVGVIGTSQLYKVQGTMFAFTPNFLDQEAFYLCLDNSLLVDLIRTDIAYLKTNWKLVGRPTIVLPILRTMLGDWATIDKSPVYRLLTTLSSGYTSGASIQVGSLSDFTPTSCIKSLDFLDTKVASAIFEIPQMELAHPNRASILITPDKFMQQGNRGRSSKIFGSVRRSSQTPPTLKRPRPKQEEKVRVEDDSLGPMVSLEVNDSPDPKLLSLAAAYSGRRRSLRQDSKLQSELSQVTSGLVTPTRRDSMQVAALQAHTLDQIVEKLHLESSIYDQADILTFLFNSYGKDFSFKLAGQDVTVGALLEELYQKAGFFGQWSLVRHTAGILKKRVEDLGPAATDLLVRQKHFSVGQPNNEIHITQPMSSPVLMGKIVQACGGDYTAVAIMQEILIYLAMFIRSEAELFHEMLRLRIGLIYNVMVTELARAMACSSEDAMERLLDLGPYDLKNLLHHILSRKEFKIDNSSEAEDETLGYQPAKQLSIVSPSKRHQAQVMVQNVKALNTSGGPVHIESVEAEDRHGQWRRRRRLDGALNRVPFDFYTEVWHILEKCPGISIGNNYLPQFPTVQEMTPDELKFALRVETVLNSLPDPEFRQMVVEVLMVIGLVGKCSEISSLGDSIVVEHIIGHAHSLFLQDQKGYGGPSRDCCCEHVGSCGGPAGFCVHFYDSAPSGRYGTMSYFAQAVADRLRGVKNPKDQCKVN